ncbi:hypothetical protein ACJX0J_014354, partial [Zea mays]
SHEVSGGIKFLIVLEVNPSFLLSVIKVFFFELLKMLISFSRFYVGLRGLSMLEDEIEEQESVIVILVTGNIIYASLYLNTKSLTCFHVPCPINWNFLFLFIFRYIFLENHFAPPAFCIVFKSYNILHFFAQNVSLPNSRPKTNSILWAS